MVSAIVGTQVESSVVACPNHRILIAKSARVITETRTISVHGALAIPAGTVYAVEVEGGEPVASIFLDVQRHRFKDTEQLAERWRKFVPSQDQAIELFEDIYNAPPPRIDRRLEQAFACFSAGADLAETARRVSLSESRLTHLFSEQLGISPRHWRRWLLMRRALFALYTGQSATRAAHFAGFADAAHLSRTCRIVTGATPTQVAALDTSFITARGSVVKCAKLRATHEGPVTEAVARAVQTSGGIGLPSAALARLLGEAG